MHWLFSSLVVSGAFGAQCTMQRRQPMWVQLDCLMNVVLRMNGRGQSSSVSTGHKWPDRDSSNGHSIYIYSIFIYIVIKMMMCAVCVLCMDSNSKPALLSVHSSKVHGTSLVLSPHGMCIIGFHLGLWLAIVCCTRASQLSPIATWQICRLDSISVKTVCTILIR